MTSSSNSSWLERLHGPACVIDLALWYHSRRRSGSSQLTALCAVSRCLEKECVLLDCTGIDAHKPSMTLAVQSLLSSCPSSSLNVPSKVRWVDITCQPFFVAVELLANEMHLARKHSLIAFSPQVVSICGSLAGKGGSIVPGSKSGRELACDEG